jgi:hypothetical protein
MAELKTKPTNQDVAAFLASIADPQKQADAHADGADAGDHRRAAEDVGVEHCRLLSDCLAPCLRGVLR